jgi:aspartyl-tRNA(Asn)/glutamyl-tRNA(Gln) amidotransferase subunit A
MSSHSPKKTALEIAAAVNAGADACSEVSAALARAKADTNNAIIRVHHDRALAAAHIVNDKIKAGQQLPLAGVPFIIKDNLCTQGIETTAASKILKGYVAPYTGTAVQRLENAGAIVIASANMDEFAFGSSNETSAYGPVKNPIDPTRIPGGSSGGSAASVAAGIAPLALGSDTGGSIRQPASLCGVVGMKPTYGRVSRYGLIAFGSSLDQIGPFAHNSADATACLRYMAGHDVNDATSAQKPVTDFDAVLSGDAQSAVAAVKGLKIGVAASHSKGLQPEVGDTLERAKNALKKAGATIVDISLPHEQYAVAIYYIIATGEASSNLARMDGVRFGHRTKEPANLHELYGKSRAEGFGREAQRRIMLGTYVLSTGYYDAYYKKAQQVRRLVCRDYEQAFTKCDMILGPVSPTTAFKVGEKMSDPLQMYLSDIFTIAANLAGVPAVSVPFGTDANKLPIGLQLQGPQFADAHMMRIAQALEQLR